MNNFEKFLIAHFIADFLLQNNWMALNKTKNVLPLFAHGIIYFICMMIAFPEVSLTFVMFISIIHICVDGLSAANLWLRVIKGRSFQSARKKAEHSIVLTKDCSIEYYISFSAIVYVVVDFLIHFITTYPILVGK